MTSIEVQGLRLRRKGGFELGPIDLSIESGSRVAILGPSGCGKTTVLRCLAGLETPDAGTIRFGDRVVHDERTSVAPSDRRIGFVFQDAALWPHLDAIQHLRFVDPGMSKTYAKELLAQVDLHDQIDRRPGTMSGGEAQRLALARALAGNPIALLLDEPMSSVDAPLRDELSVLVHRVCEARGLTLIVVTHDRREALAIAEELVILHAGRIVETGPASRVLRDPRTSYAAAFVGGATCLPVTRSADGTIDSLFGSFRPPAHDKGNEHGSHQLVVLPGDVVLAGGDRTEGDRFEGNRPEGRVLRVIPTADGALATVDVAGHTLNVPCAESTLPGSTLTIALRGEPRILPSGGHA